MQAIPMDWTLDIQRGPQWLWVRVRPPEQPAGHVPWLEPRLRRLLEMHSTYHLILELDGFSSLPVVLVGHLLSLARWIRGRDGFLRLCGLSPQGVDLIERCGLAGYLPSYQDREEALCGGQRSCQPRQPR